MSNNDDLINDILKELDNEKNTVSPQQDEADVNPDSNYQEQPQRTYFSHEKSPFDNIPSPAEPVSTADNVYPQPTSQPVSQNNYQYQQPPQSINNMPRVRKKKKKKKRSRLPGVLILTTFIFAVSICLSLVIIAFGKDMLGIGKSDTPHLIVIEEGVSTEQIAYMLKDEGIIKSPKFFMLFSKLRKSDSMYIAGEHFVRPNMAYEAIIHELTSTENEMKESVEVTFPEGITVYDAASILQEAGVCTYDDFIFNFNAGGYGFEFENLLPTNSTLKFCRMEGYMFPDTYFFYKDMDPEHVCQKIYMNFEQKMTDERLNKMKQLGLSLDELITFASIVQKEAATVDTMNIVASVFWNRLNNKDIFPRLESDPTSNYANNVIKPNLDVYDKTLIEAYDTYLGTGLPPGAICNPGIDAIDAVLNAIPTEYFYFYANIYSGETLYAKTYEEHLANEAEIKRQIEEYEATSEAAGQEGNNE